jgi:hypothetical protein
LTPPGAARLADGNYRLTVPAGWLVDASGNPLPEFHFDFFVLAGDVNRDRAVNFDDLLVLAKNYNGTGKAWADGDLTGDGVVNFDDLLVLAKAYNNVLPAPVAVVAPLLSAMTAATTTSVLGGESKSASVFSTSRVGKAKPVAPPKPVATKPKGAARPKGR